MSRIGAIYQVVHEIAPFLVGSGRPQVPAQVLDWASQSHLERYETWRRLIEGNLPLVERCVPNHLRRVRLKSSYLGVRHGFDAASEEGVVVTLPINAMSGEYGLTGWGRIDAERQFMKWLCDNPWIRREVQKGNVFIFTSDYRRAIETAGILGKVLDLPNERIARLAALRERNLGLHEFSPSSVYDEISELDRKNPFNRMWKVESMAMVRDRFTRAVVRIDQKIGKGKTALLVGHRGSILIGETGFRDVPVTEFFLMPYFEFAGMRTLHRAV